MREKWEREEREMREGGRKSEKKEEEKRKGRERGREKKYSIFLPGDKTDKRRIWFFHRLYLERDAVFGKGIYNYRKLL